MNSRPVHLLLLALLLGMPTRAWAQAMVVETQGLRVELTGVGKRAAQDVKAVIQEQVLLTRDTVVSPPLADDLAFFVRQRYLDLGFPEATVGWEIRGGAAVLDVEEGREFRVGRIRYEGNTAQDEAQLTRYLLRPTHDKLGGSALNPVFVKADLEAGVQLVERYYQAQGYLDATVAGPVLEFVPAAAVVNVVLPVREERRYQVGGVSLEGDRLGKDKEIRSITAMLEGQPFSEVKVEEARARMVGIYQREGYFAATVTASGDPDSHVAGMVAVKFVVDPGPVHEVVALEIDSSFSEGAKRLIQASFNPAVGTVYSPQGLEIMNRRLLDSGVFARMELEPVAQPGGTLVLRVRGEEGMRTTVGFYGGYETFQGPIVGAEVRQVNFMNSGNTVGARAEYTGRGVNGSLKFVDPALLGSRYRLSAEAGAEHFAIFDYERNSLLGRLGLERRWDKHTTTSLSGEVSTNRSESEGLDATELGPDGYQTGALGVAAVFDYRNSPVVPTDGWMASVGVSAAGGDVSYLRSEVAVSVYQPLTRKLRMAASARARAVQTGGGVEALPIDLRLFNGGATSVRSFVEREMGLKSKSGTPLGGSATHVFSVELSYEIRPNLELALFGDAGSVSRDEDTLVASPEDLRYAIGLGIRYKLPVGPLRVDYGFNPDRRDGEDLGALHITFGFAF